MSDDAEALRRAALGSILRNWRASQGLSVEAVAERAHLAHTTWRRIEDGHSVWPRTRTAIEQAAGLPTGLVTRSLKDDDAAVELAEHLGIEVSEDQNPQAFVRSFGWPTAWAQQLAAQGDDDLDIATALLKRLSAHRNRSAVESEALAAVHALVGEWAGVSG